MCMWAQCRFSEKLEQVPARRSQRVVLTTCRMACSCSTLRRLHGRRERGPGGRCRWDCERRETTDRGPASGRGVYAGAVNDACAQGRVRVLRGGRAAGDSHERAARRRGGRDVVAAANGAEGQKCVWRAAGVHRAARRIDGGVRDCAMWGTMCLLCGIPVRAVWILLLLCGGSCFCQVIVSWM